MSHQEEDFKAVDYADHEVQEYINTPVPRFLIWTYILLPIWGLIVMWAYWDGSWGWLDRGYWRELQVSSGTTIEKDFEDPIPPKKRVLDKKQSM